MEYFVKITPTEKGCSVETVQNAEPGLTWYYSQIGCRSIEVVRLNLKSKKQVLVIDEEGRLRKNPQLNYVASLLYGDIIYGTVLLCKEDLRDGEPDIVGFDQQELEAARLALHFALMESDLFNYRTVTDNDRDNYEMRLLRG